MSFFKPKTWKRTDRDLYAMIGLMGSLALGKSFLWDYVQDMIKKNRIRDDQNLIDSENLQNRYILPPLTKKQMRNLGKLTKEQRHEFFLDRDEPFDRIKHKVFKAEVDKKRKSGEYKEAIYPPPDGHDIEYEEYTDEELFHYSVIMQKETGFSASY